MWTRLACCLLVAQTVSLPSTDPYADFPWPYASSVNHTEYKRDTPDDGISFCRLQFTSNRVEDGGNGWRTDYPLAGRHLALRFREMTPARVVMRDEDPVVWVVKPDSPGLMRCPLLLASDVGTLVWSTEEVSLMREYLARGGFIFADDYWGEVAWLQWYHGLSQIVPGVVVEELPPDHEIFRMLYHVNAVPQMSNLHYWQSTGKMSERGADSVRAELHAAYDTDGRMVAVMSYNTDLGDAWEREFDSREYFDLVAADSYALTINLLLYVMSH